MFYIAVQYLPAMSSREKVTINVYACNVLDRHADLNCYSAYSSKQQ